ncbi:MAG TPA: VOC family protein, partial [Gemmatimonadales bacterium]|nr:VOC family protein [Gemmatimonadales bacterium]
MATLHPIAPCLWFDDQAEDAAAFYISIFPNSKIVSVARYGEAGKETHGRPPGSVMVVEFELNGQPFTALNGGPVFTFNEAVSFQLYCETQEELDRYWEKLGAGGDPKAQVCGWLKDKFGLSWQVVPTG